MGFFARIFSLEESSWANASNGPSITVVVKGAVSSYILFMAVTKLFMFNDFSSPTQTYKESTISMIWQENSEPISSLQNACTLSFGSCISVGAAIAAILNVKSSLYHAALAKRSDRRPPPPRSGCRNWPTAAVMMINL